jgi:lysophospholipase L1-like esterase
MSFLKNAAITLASIIVSLLLLEMIVRYFSPQDLRFNFSQWDEYVGFVNIPGTQGVTVHQDYRMAVNINSKGLRDREVDYTKGDNTYRIGVFGDSFTFGEGVQDNETYPKLLENLLNADAQLNGFGRKIEVLNFGIGKTGTSHQYALYRKEGKKYHLDLVIVGFFALNDFDDNFSGVFTLKDDQLIHNPAAYSSIRQLQKIVYYLPFYKWLTGHSHLSNFIRKKATLLDDRRRMKMDTQANVTANADPEKDRYEVAITQKLLSEFTREVKQDGAKLILVNLPAKNQRPFSDYGANDAPPGYVVLSSRVERALNENHDPERVDFTPLFAKLPVDPYYFPNDGHMTPLGLQLVALGIKDYLEPKLIKELKSSSGKR